MRATIICSDIKPPFYGGYHRKYVHTLGQLLSKRGVDLDVISVLHPTKEHDVLSVLHPTKKRHVVSTDVIDGVRYHFLSLRYRDLLRRRKRLTPLLEDLQPDVIDLHGTAMWVSRYATIGRRLGRPIICSIHEIERISFRDVKRLGMRKLSFFLRSGRSSGSLSTRHLRILLQPRRILFKNLGCECVSKIIVLGQSARQYLSEYVDPSLLEVIPPGVSKEENVDEEGLPELRSTLSIGNDERVFLYYGSPRILRGVDVLIKAFYHVKKSWKNVRLMLILLSDEPYLRTLIKRYNLGDSVNVITGVQPNISNFLHLSDIVVLPFEITTGMVADYPLTLLESMALGKPVISTSHPQIREIIENGETGILVKPGDPVELSRAMSKLLSNDLLRRQIGENASKYIGRKFDWDRIADKILQVYKEACT